MKPEAASFLQSFMDNIKKFYVTRVKGFDPYSISVATLVFEGTAEEVAAQEKRVYDIAADFRSVNFLTHIIFYAYVS